MKRARRPRGLTVYTTLLFFLLALGDGHLNRSHRSFGHAALARQGGGGPFQQVLTDGLVVMEAESYHSNTPRSAHNWILVTTPAGFIGSGAMQASPDANAGYDTNYAAQSPQLDFNVNFVVTGTHYVWVRGYGVNGSGDSVHVGLDGVEINTSDRIYFNIGNYSWSNATMDGPAATFTVSQVGVHTVNVWMREDGFIFDRILLTTNPSYPLFFGDTSAGPPESPRNPPPEAPTLLGTAGVLSANLSWTPGGGGAPTSYNVLRSTTSGGPYTQIASVTGTTYTDVGLTSGTTYYYVVQAANQVGVSPNSNQVAITPLPLPPRTNDHDEGFVGDRCACGASLYPAFRWRGISVLLAVLAAALFVGRRR